jgi:hypothetical protein
MSHIGRLVVSALRCVSKLTPIKYGANKLKVKQARKAGKGVRREWTKTDVKELKAHSKAKTPVTKISKETKRTIGALRQKALHLGIGLGHQR